MVSLLEGSDRHKFASMKEFPGCWYLTSLWIPARCILPFYDQSIVSGVVYQIAMVVEYSQQLLS